MGSSERAISLVGSWRDFLSLRVALLSMRDSLNIPSYWASGCPGGGTCWPRGGTWVRQSALDSSISLPIKKTLIKKCFLFCSLHEEMITVFIYYCIPSSSDKYSSILDWWIESAQLQVLNLAIMHHNKKMLIGCIYTCHVFWEHRALA